MHFAYSGSSRRKLSLSIVSLIVVLLLPIAFLQLSTAPGVYGQSYSGGDFGFGLSPPRIVGCTATYTILYTPSPGFSESVTESAWGVPFASFSMGAFLLSTRMIDTLTVDGLSPGTTYYLTVTAYAFGVAHSVTTNLVTPPRNAYDTCSSGLTGTGSLPTPDFDMSAALTNTPADALGNTPSVSFLIDYDSINGFAETLHESVTNAPVGSVWFFSSQRVPSWGYCRVVQSHCSDVLTMAGLPPGNYTVIVTAAPADGSPYHQLVINFYVPAPVAEYPAMSLPLLVSLLAILMTFTYIRNKRSKIRVLAR